MCLHPIVYQPESGWLLVSYSCFGDQAELLQLQTKHGIHYQDFRCEFRISSRSGCSFGLQETLRKYTISVEYCKIERRHIMLVLILSSAPTIANLNNKYNWCPCSTVQTGPRVILGESLFIANCKHSDQVPNLETTIYSQS